MTSQFTAGTPWREGRNVRKLDDLIDLFHKTAPDGAVWTVIAPRRHGKTWALKEIEHQFKKEQLDVELLALNTQQGRTKLGRKKQKRFLLLDEPSGSLFPNDRSTVDATRDFLTKLEKLKEEDTRVVLALTPREYHILAQADGDNGTLNAKDRRWLSPLTEAETKKFVSTREGVAWAEGLISKLPELWRRNPFLLESALQVAEANDALRGADDLTELLKQAKSLTEKAPAYAPQVWNDALDESNRDIIRSVVRTKANPDGDDGVLEGCGLIRKSKTKGLWELGDPVLIDYLPPPLRIHHISDLHFGEKSALSVDAKAKGKQGRRLADGAGLGPVRDEYLTYLATLGDERPHVVVVSGDIAERGDDGLYDEAKKWFATLTKQIVKHDAISKDQSTILLVGGNHDVDWNATLGPDGERKRHLPFARAFDGYPRPNLETPPTNRALTTVRFDENRIEVVLLGSAEFGGEQEEHPAWQRTVDQINEIASQVKLQVEKDDWAEASRLLKDIGKIDPGLVHHKDLERLRTHPTKAAAATVRIAVLHHPVSPMPHGVEIARYAGLINAGQVKAACIDAKVSLILHGHMHAGWLAEESWPGHTERKWILRIASAATLGNREKDEQHGFNEIVITREGEEMFLSVQRLVRKDSQNWIADGMRFEKFKPGAEAVDLSKT